MSSIAKLDPCFRIDVTDYELGHTWYVTVDGECVYESADESKCQGVWEYLVDTLRREGKI
jgi:hypothetical protein